MTKITQAEQNKINTLIGLCDKESALLKKMDGLRLRRHESQKNHRAYKKLEDRQEKVFLQFSDKYKVLPEHCATQVINYSGYQWEDFQED